MAPPYRCSIVWLLAVRTGALLLLLPLAAGGCSEETPSRTLLATALPDPLWTARSSENACEARWLACRGWIAVNREHGQQVDAWYARENSE